MRGLGGREFDVKERRWGIEEEEDKERGWTMNTDKRYDGWREGRRERKEGQT